MKQNSRRSPSRIRDGSRGKPVPEGPLDVRIDRLGDGGDGIAETACGRLYIPLSLPGEQVRVRPLRPRGDGFVAQVVDVLAPGAARQPPPCPHFGVCGGCALQHLTDDAYAAWKTARLAAALARVGLAADGDVVAPLVRTPPGSRRRATFTALRARAGGVHLGFQVRDGHAVVDLVTCLVLDAAILPLLPELRRLFGAMLAPGGRASATVTLLDGGLDVLLTGVPPRSLQDHERLARFAGDANLARLSWRTDDGAAAEPLAVRRPARVVFGGIAVAVPPAGFLQPSLAGEAALLAAVRAGVGGARVIADLFCGCGTFALPLAQREVRLHAIDADADAVAALSAAARSVPALAPRLRCERRDLFTRPLAAGELAGFEAVVLDPPRAGARAQVAALAASAVPVVVYVSCNPATFARDARLLADGGYRLERITPVDQFVWSPHLELVAVFGKREEK